MLYLLAALFALLLWWSSTGLLLFLNRLGPHTFRWNMLGGTLLTLAALYGFTVSAADASVGGAYLAFVCGLTVWGWQEMSYYMGWITGPRSQSCARGCRGWRHFIHAAELSLYHELAIVAAALLLTALSWGQPNLVGLWTYLLLWGMRISAKLNLFLGVRNVNLTLLPEHLAYLRNFIRKRSMNLLFPLSISAGTALVVLLALAAANAASAFAAVGATLLTTLAALAVLEHWLLMLPLSLDALWQRQTTPRPVGRGKTRGRTLLSVKPADC